jgi:hypothetical integral membrane protein (TIGR02206 family)
VDGLKYFFRADPDMAVFPKFNLIHLVILMVLVAGIIWLLYMIKKKSPRVHRVYQILAVILCIEQVTHYSWYFFSLEFDATQALPLYSCRIAMLALIIGGILRSDVILLFGAYLGFLGGIVALVYPYIDPYAFPHITNFTFVIGHLVCTWLSIVVLSEKVSSKRQMVGVFVLLNIFLVITYVVNATVDANYAYLMWSPIAESYFLRWPHFLYVFCVYCTYVAIILLTYFITKKGLKNITNQDHQMKVKAYRR